MKLACLIVGENIVHNKIFFDSIINKVTKKFAFPTTLKYIKKNDKNTLFILEELAKNHNNLIVFTNEESFVIISKILATLTKDSLSVKMGFLIPSKTLIFEKNSYLIKFGNSNINILSVKEGDELPNILIDCKNKFLHVNILGADNSILKNEIEEFCKLYKNNHIVISSICENYSLLHVRLNGFTNTEKLFLHLRKIFKNIVIIKGDIVEHIIKEFSFKNKMISFAESCTGGLISYLFTSKQDVSKIFNGSVVSYSYDFKKTFLHVRKSVLDKYGSVSKECIYDMLDGILKNSNSNFAIAVSGIAGPGGGTAQKPVGLVYIGIQEKNSEPLVLELNLKGDRFYVQYQSAMIAIINLILYEKSLQK